MQLQRKEFTDIMQEAFKDETGDFLNKRVCAILIDVFATAIAKVLANGDSVNIRGFGTFCIKKRKPKTYLNPNNHAEKLEKPETVRPHFVAGKELTRLVKEKYNESKENIQANDKGT